MRSALRASRGAPYALMAYRLATCAAITSLLLLAQPVSAALQVIVEDTGLISVSVDGEGNNFADGGVLEVSRPPGATVRSAHLFAAGVPWPSMRDIEDGDISLLGTPVSWDRDVINDGGDFVYNNVYADVTDIVGQAIDNVTGGPINIAVTEVNPTTIDGTILVVIFDDPNLSSERSVILLFGGQDPAGDTFVIHLTDPIDLSGPDAIADMGLGISFGCQGEACFGWPEEQVSEIDVNGQDLSCAAGGGDDASSGGEDGTHVTVGGVGDSNDNPDPPCSPPDGNSRADDELYDLLPFVNDGDFSISVETINPAGDDNIFFAYVITPPASVLCGDGVVGTGETCDDGNAQDGDCCSSQCLIEPGGTQCRAAFGSCDVAEFCDGASDSCPADVFDPSGTVCRPGRDVCDRTETCTGVDPFCPVNQLEPEGTECRASAGPCDVADACDGEHASCPEDVFQPTGILCRGSAGVCDAVETCTGEGALCPADGFLAPGTLCRGSAGVCDAVETCTGQLPFCPADGFLAPGTLCRGLQGPCDVAESCTGAGASCPADGFQAPGALCREVAGECDVAESCTGAGASCPADGFQAPGTVCRELAGECDVAESCAGAGSSCPVDGFQTDGFPCPDDRFCNGDETCQSGECTDGPDPAELGLVCREDPIVHDPTGQEPGWPEGIEITGAGRDRLAYLAAEEHGLRIYSVSDPASPISVGSYLPALGVCPQNDFIFDEVAMVGTTAYVAAGLCGLLIVDVGDPGAPVLLHRVATPGWAKEVKVHTSAGGTMAYVADYGGGLRIIQVSGPEAPVELGSLGGAGGLLGSVLSVHVEEDAGRILLYVATTEGFFVIDASFAALPVVLGSTNTKLLGVPFDPGEDTPQDALVIGDRAYVPIWMGGLLVVDVSDPSAPVVLQEVETVPGQAFFKVAAGGANVYVTEGQCGLRVFGTTEEGLAPVFFETLENPIKLGGGVGECTESSPDPWAWALDEAGGLVFATSGVWGPPGEREGNFQSIDFRQPGSGLRILGGRRGCGLGLELVLLLPLLAGCRRLRGLSRYR